MQFRQELLMQKCNTNFRKVYCLPERGQHLVGSLAGAARS